MTPNTQIPPGLDLFDCARRRVRLTRPACAKMWDSAQERRPEPYEGRYACMTCPVGAFHSTGKPMAAPLVAEAVEAIRPVCPRCVRPATRLIGGRWCPSCYNRSRELRIGRNTKGNPPVLLPSRLHVPPVAMVNADGARRLEGVVVSSVEAMIATSKLVKQPIAFSRARLDLESLATDAGR